VANIIAAAVVAPRQFGNCINSILKAVSASAGHDRQNDAIRSVDLPATPRLTPCDPPGLNAV
jgi:hypothetical protein